MSAVLALAVLSCTQTAEPEGYGYVDISVARDSSVDDVDITASAVSAATKAGTSDAIALTIYDAAGEVAYQTDDCSQVTEPVSLSTGQYRAVATSGLSLSDGAAAFDTPFYSAAKEFTVRRGTVETLEMTLTLEAVMVTAEFSQDIQDNFSSYVLTVSNGVSSLEFGKSDAVADAAGDGSDGAASASGDGETVPATGKTGYFAVTGTLTYSLSLTGNDGRVFSPLTQTYTDVKAKQHYAFSFSVAEKQPEGGAAITIVVDDSMTEKEHDILLDFTVQDIPEITDSFSAVDGGSFYAGDASPKIVYVDLKKPAASVMLINKDTGLGEAGLPEETELVNADGETLAMLSGLGIAASAVTAETLNAEIDFTEFFASLPAGSYSFEIFVQNEAGGEQTAEIRFEVLPVVEALAANAWARFADLSGRWLTEEQPEGLGFQYRTGDEEWTNVDADVTVNAEAKTFEAELHGLAAGTQYEYRAVTAAFRENQPVQFTTETEQVLHNMSFDKWYMEGKAPMPNASADYKIWDSANPGSASFNIVPTTQETSNLAVTGENKSAAKLTTLSAPVVGLAAGNIYTGIFEGTVGGIIPSGAALEWGVLFSSRPLALKGFYDYRPVAIDVAKGPYTDMKGQTDIGRIQFILTDWDAPFRIDTSAGTFVDVQNDEHIIAYASLDLGKTDGYQPFTLELEYRDRTRTPKYIVIVAAASKYGDYFTGGVGSTLYLDEFSFVYDPAELD